MFGIIKNTLAKVFTQSLLLSVFIAALLPLNVSADSFFEVSAGPSRYALDIFRKRLQNFADDSNAFNMSVAAYRHSSDVSAWGAVIDYTVPIGRDSSLPGDGTMLTFRPLNYLRYIGWNTSLELYAGAAQYEWRRTANGYVFGTSIRYEFESSNVSVGFDAKYFQDLSHDATNVDGDTEDNIVDGFNTGFRVYYRF